MDKSATIQWDNLKLRFTTLVTLNYFVKEFNEQYYTYFHIDKKRQEFFKLKQFGRTMTEYETKLKELSKFVPKLVNSDEYFCSKFEEGFSLKVRENMSIIGT